MVNEAIILAGGLGTRLRTVVNDRPKSMAIINKKPFLAYLLNYLIKQGLDTFILSVGYKSACIFDFFGNEYKGCKIIYAEEKEPLGTGGAIINALQYSRSKMLLVTNGDSLLKADIRKLYDYHLSKNADITLAVKLMHNFDRYGTVKLNAAGRIVAFKEKTKQEKGVINGGLYLFNKEVVKTYKLGKTFSIEKDFFEKHLTSLNLYGLCFNDYFIDIGLPMDLEKAQIELAN